MTTFKPELSGGNYAFFKALADAVKPFRSHLNMENANVDGTLVLMARKNNRQKILFGFMAKRDNMIKIEIDCKDILANPKEYIENMLECLDQGMQQMSNTTIHLPSRELSLAVNNEALH